jgi:hypothetical protein
MKLTYVQFGTAVLAFAFISVSSLAAMLLSTLSVVTLLFSRRSLPGRKFALVVSLVSASIVIWVIILIVAASRVPAI